VNESVDPKTATFALPQNDPTALPSTITTESAERPPTIETITLSISL
jgi:hypothetical protein